MKTKKRVHIKPKSDRYSLKTRVQGFQSHRWHVPDQMKAVENKPKFHGLDTGIYGAEIKYDGTRVFLLKSGSTVKVYGASRLKNEYTPRYPMLVNDGKRLNASELVLDCELTFFDKNTGNDIFITALARPETISQYDIKLMCFDVLFYDDYGWDVKNLPYPERKRILKSVIPTNLDHIKYVWWRKDRQRNLYDTWVGQGGEGVMIKLRHGHYREGVRSPEWRKIKADNVDDAFVVGWTDGQGSRAPYFAALTTAQYKPDGNIKFTGNVGGGYNQQDLVKIKQILSSLPTEPVSPFNLPDRRDAGTVHYVQPSFVIEVKFMQRTSSGKFRMPRFIRMRPDKTPAECIYNPTNV